MLSISFQRKCVELKARTLSFEREAAAENLFSPLPQMSLEIERTSAQWATWISFFPAPCAC